MWQSIQAISDYKPTYHSPPSTDISFLNKLNNFYARFERDNQELTNKIMFSADHQPFTLSTSEVSTALSRINARNAAVFSRRAGELAGVLTDLFNLSLARATVPACFKTTSTVPIPKNSSATCLNDYRPVALTPHHHQVL